MKRIACLAIILGTCCLIGIYVVDTESMARYLRYSNKPSGGVQPSTQKHNAEIDIEALKFRNVVLDQPVSKSDIPFFWHVHKSDEIVVKRILGECFGRELVELNDMQSIEEAKETNLLAQSSMSNVVITSPHLKATGQIFTNNHQGRLFSFFRHPVDYEISDTLPIDANNWLTRELSETPEGSLTFKELGIAKHIIRESCVVGTMEHVEESLKRIGAYFGWELTSEKCITDTLRGFRPPTFLDHNSLQWKVLHERNAFDGLMYEFADSTWRGQLQTIVPYHLQLARAQKKN